MLVVVLLLVEVLVELVVVDEVVGSPACVIGSPEIRKSSNDSSTDLCSEPGMFFMWPSHGVVYKYAL